MAVIALATVALVVACGGSGGEADNTPQTTPTATSSAPATHQAEAGEPELIAVPGFEYGDDVGQVAQVCELFSAEMISECSVHTVTGLGNGFLIVMGFAPDVPLGENAAADMVQGMSTGGTGRVVMETIDGEQVATMDAGDGKTIIAGWAHDRTMYMAQGEDGDALEEYVTGYITGQNS